MIKHSGHLRTLEKCRKHSPAARVFYISIVFSSARRVLSQCNTRLRLLYLLNIPHRSSTTVSLDYYTLNSLSLFRLAERVQWIFRIGARDDKGDFCLIGWFFTLALRLLLNARCRNLKNKDGVRKSDFNSDFALSLDLDCKVNVPIFFLCPLSQFGSKMYGGITQTFHVLPFSPLLATVSLVAFVLACSWL